MVKKSKRTSYESSEAKKWYNKKYSAKDLAIKALKKSAYLASQINSEVFKHDTSTTQAVGSSGIIYPMTQIAIGDSASTRTGNSLLAKYISIHLDITHNAAATATLHRVILFIDTQQVADTTPSVTDILANPSVRDFYNLATVGRFKILQDMRFITNNVVSPTKSINLSKTFNKGFHHVRYNGSAATDLQKGGIYLLCLSTEATNTPTYNFLTRFAYHDN